MIEKSGDISDFGSNDGCLTANPAQFAFPGPFHPSINQETTSWLLFRFPIMQLSSIMLRRDSERRESSTLLTTGTRRRPQPPVGKGHVCQELELFLLLLLMDGRHSSYGCRSNKILVVVGGGYWRLLLVVTA